MALPVYEMVINPEVSSDVEVAAVAFVDKPAIEKNFMAFSDQKMIFAVDPEQRIVSGPAMVADQLIYRKDDSGEYNVFFSKDTIKQIALKFFKKDYQKNLNLFHDPTLSLEGVTIFESFVSDQSRGIQPMKGFEDLPDGTWFISAKVENEQVWSAVKSGQVKGFSVEGIFSFMKLNRPVQKHSRYKDETDIMSELKDLWSKFKEKFLGDLPPAGAPAPGQKLSQDLPLKDGTMISVDKLEVGGIAMVNDVPAAAGVLELADGTKITVGDGGVIQAVEMPGAPAPAAQASDYSEQFKAFDEKFTAWDQKFAEHITAYNTMAQEFGAQKEQVRQLVELVGKIIETPTAESVQGDKSQFSSQKQTVLERRSELASLLSKLKKK